MASTQELPQLTSELVDLTKAYLVQETMEPAKKLGKTAGMTMAAGLLFAIGGALLAVVARNVIVDALPDGAYWAALGLGLAGLLVFGAAGLIVAYLSRTADSESSQLPASSANAIAAPLGGESVAPTEAATSEAATSGASELRSAIAEPSQPTPEEQARQQQALDERSPGAQTPEDSQQDTQAEGEEI